MAVKVGQVYEATKTDDWGIRRRIRVVFIPAIGGKIRVRVAPLNGGRTSEISLASLHESRNTLMGKPWRTGYVLIKDVQD